MLCLLLFISDLFFFVKPVGLVGFLPPAGVAGRSHSDLLLLRPGLGLAHRTGQLQHLPQRRLQVGGPHRCC